MSARQGETWFQEIYVRCNSGHTRQVDLQSFGRPLYSEQKSESRQEEPDYDLPTESIPPSPHPSRSDAPHEDEGTAQAKSRMRRPAPQSIEEERKIKPFAKKPITFMFHATYGENLISIMEHGLKSGRSLSNPSGRVPSTPCESVKTISGGKTFFTVKVIFYRGQFFYRCRCRCRCREKLFFYRGNCRGCCRGCLPRCSSFAIIPSKLLRNYLSAVVSQ